MKGETCDGTVVSFEHFQTLSRWNVPNTNARIGTARDGDVLERQARERFDEEMRLVSVLYFVEMMNDVRHFLLVTLEGGNHLFAVLVEDHGLSIAAT